MLVRELGSRGSLKDQNMHIINQVASTLPAEASGLDLNRRLLEYTMTQKEKAPFTQLCWKH